jgi:hypothetical protein
VDVERLLINPKDDDSTMQVQGISSRMIILVILSGVGAHANDAVERSRDVSLPLPHQGVSAIAGFCCHREIVTMAESSIKLNMSMEAPAPEPRRHIGKRVMSYKAA